MSRNRPPQLADLLNDELNPTKGTVLLCHAIFLG